MFMGGGRERVPPNLDFILANQQVVPGSKSPLNALEKITTTWLPYAMANVLTVLPAQY